MTTKSERSGEQPAGDQGAKKKVKKLKLQNKDSTPLALTNLGSDPAPKGQCAGCEDGLCMWSARSKRHITLCEKCNEQRKRKNNESYHNRHKIHHKEQAMTEQLSSRGQKLYEARRDCSDVRERLAVLQKRYDSLQEAYEASQKMLAASLDHSNGGSQSSNAVHLLPSAVSVRTESIVVQRLQELTEILTDWRSQSKSELSSIAVFIKEEHADSKTRMDVIVSELEKVMHTCMSGKL